MVFISVRIRYLFPYVLGAYFRTFLVLILERSWYLFSYVLIAYLMKTTSKKLTGPLENRSFRSSTPQAVTKSTISEPKIYVCVCENRRVFRCGNRTFLIGPSQILVLESGPVGRAQQILVLQPPDFGCGNRAFLIGPTRFGC